MVAAVSRGGGSAARSRAAAVFSAAVLFAGAAWLVAFFPKGELKDLGRFISECWPPGERLIPNVLGGAAALCLAAAMLSIYDSLGLVVMRWLNFRAPRGVYRFAPVFIAYPLAGTFLLGLALSGLWYKPAIAGLLAVMAAASLLNLPGSVLAARSGILSWWNGFGVFGKTLAVLAAVTLTAPLLSPEIFVDSMEYHLSFPRQILERHRIFSDGVYEAWAYPMAADFPNVFSMIFGLDAAAKAVRPAFLLLGGLALVSARGIGPVRPALGLGLVWLAALMPSARFTLLTAKNDPVLCGVLLVISALVLERFSRPARHGFPAGRILNGVVLAGALAGAAAGMKYVAFPFAAALFGAIFLGAGGLSGLMPSLAAAAAIPFVWGLKNLLCFGDPLHPFGMMAFPALAPDEAAAELMRKTWAVYTGMPEKGVFPGGIPALFAEMFVAAAAAVFYLRRRLPPGFSAVLGAWLAALLAVGFAVKGDAALTHRFGYPAFVAVNLMSLAAVVAGTSSAGVRRAVISAGILLPALGIVLQSRLIAASAGFSPCLTSAAYASGKYGGEEYREASLCSYGAILPALREAAAREDGRGAVLCVGGLMTWGIPGNAVVKWLAPFFVWKAARETESPERMAVKFRQKKVRWILYNALLANWYWLNEFPDSWTPAMAKRYAAFASRHFEPAVFSGRVDPPSFGSLWLIEVRPEPAAKGASVFFLPGAEGVFRAYGALYSHDKYSEAAEELRRIKGILPGVVCVDAMLGNSLLGAGRLGEAYFYAKATLEAGLVYDGNVLVWAITAARTGRKEEAIRVFRLASALYPAWPGQVEKVYKRSGLVIREE